MASLYPLRFHPILRRAVWGGRRLADDLQKPLPEGIDFSESWEVSDHGKDQSVVAAGPLAGSTLNQLVRDHGRELLGRHHPQRQFPLLFKFLDARERLSVQVHPDDHRAAKIEPPQVGKTEAWVVLSASPDSVIYAGLKRGFDRPAVERELARGTLELCLHHFQPQAGDCVFLPAGTVHALGGQLLVAEIQQTSDVTYRLFDWNRLTAEGAPRQLHIDEALDAIDFDHGPVNPLPSRSTERPHVSRLVECDKFILDRHELVTSNTVGGDERCHLIAVLEGAVTVPGDPAGSPLTKGHTMLIPAVWGQLSLEPLGNAVLLDAYLP